jgi:membrane protease YdiL (CAAX protease family)
MKSPITLFLLFAFGISWAIAAVAHAAGFEYGSGLATLVVGGLFMLGPALAAIIVRRLFERKSLMPLGLSLKETDWRWMGITALAGMALVPLALGFNSVLGALVPGEAFGRTEVTMDMMKRTLAGMLDEQGLEAATSQLDMLDFLPGWGMLLLILLAGLASAATVNLPFMFGEEFGWRGMLYHHTRSWSTLKIVLFTGVCWGLWHAPIILQGHNYPGYPVAGVFMMTLFTTVLALPFHIIRRRTNSVWGPCLLHGIINSTAGGMVYFTEGGHELLASIAGVSGMLSIATVTLLLMVLDQRAARKAMATG